MRPIGHTCATALQRSPLLKLLWADLFIIEVTGKAQYNSMQVHTEGLAIDLTGYRLDSLNS